MIKTIYSNIIVKDLLKLKYIIIYAVFLFLPEFFMLLGSLGSSSGGRTLFICFVTFLIFIFAFICFYDLFSIYKLIIVHGESGISTLEQRSKVSRKTSLTCRILAQKTISFSYILLIIIFYFLLVGTTIDISLFNVYIFLYGFGLFSLIGFDILFSSFIIFLTCIRFKKTTLIISSIFTFLTCLFPISILIISGFGAISPDNTYIQSSYCIDATFKKYTSDKGIEEIANILNVSNDERGEEDSFVGVSSSLTEEQKSTLENAVEKAKKTDPDSPINQLYNLLLSKSSFSWVSEYYSDFFINSVNKYFDDELKTPDISYFVYKNGSDETSEWIPDNYSSKYSNINFFEIIKKCDVFKSDKSTVDDSFYKTSSSITYSGVDQIKDTLKKLKSDSVWKAISDSGLAPDLKQSTWTSALNTINKFYLDYYLANKTVTSSAISYIPSKYFENVSYFGLRNTLKDLPEFLIKPTANSSETETYSLSPIQKWIAFLDPNWVTLSNILFPNYGTLNSAIIMGSNSQVSHILQSFYLPIELKGYKKDGVLEYDFTSWYNNYYGFIEEIFISSIFIGMGYYFYSKKEDFWNE